MTSVETNVTVPPDFFSLEPPGRKFVPAQPKQVRPPRAGTKGTVLQKVGGGQLQMTDYTKGPAVLVIGDEVQLRPALARMQRVTGGNLPTVVGVLRPSSDPAHPVPTKPFDVPVAQMADPDAVWEKLSEGQNWPVALFCRAKPRPAHRSRCGISPTPSWLQNSPKSADHNLGGAHPTRRTP